MTGIRPPKPTQWQRAEVVSTVLETPRVRTLRLAPATWPEHLPGQHVDVRLTAGDGYRAERSYSIASPPASPVLELTVERIADGEVSPYLADQLRPGDLIDLRGPIGGHFVWSAKDARKPLLLLAGGCGIVPLMCMLRHRRLSDDPVAATLVYSCRKREDVVYHEELRDIAQTDHLFSLQITLTRDAAPGWPGAVGRIDLSTVRSELKRLGGVADSYVCGRNGFVETASGLLIEAGQSADDIRTERFGPSGP